MADDDDLDARKARAADLRAQISNIVGSGKSPVDKGAKLEKEGGPPSPREFIERRMRELDAAKDASNIKSDDPGNNKKPGR